MYAVLVHGIDLWVIQLQTEKWKHSTCIFVHTKKYIEQIHNKAKRKIMFGFSNTTTSSQIIPHWVLLLQVLKRGIPPVTPEQRKFG